METIKRLCCSESSTTVSDSEHCKLNTQHNSMHKDTKQFLANRKTMLRFVMIVNIFIFLIEIIMFINIIVSLERNSLEYIVIITTSLTNFIITLIKLMFIIYAQIHWYNYRKSSNSILLCAVVIFIFPIIALYIPYKQFIGYDDDIIIQNLILFVILKMLINMSMPIIFMLQMKITVIRKLIKQMNDVSEFKYLAIPITVIYLLLINVGIGTVFQIIQDMRIFGFGLSYSTYLIISLLKNVFSRSYHKYLSNFLAFIEISVIISTIILFAFLSIDYYLDDMINVSLASISALILAGIIYRDIFIRLLFIIRNDKMYEKLINSSDNVEQSIIIFGRDVGIINYNSHSVNIEMNIV